MLSYWTDGQQGQRDASLAEGEENGGFGSNTNVCIIVFTHFALIALRLMYSRDIKERDAVGTSRHVALSLSRVRACTPDMNVAKGKAAHFFASDSRGAPVI